MGSSSFFLPIDSKNVPVYFGHAIVASKQYITSKSPDLQDRFSGNLLVTKKPWTTDNDCSLEIVLSENEIMRLSDVSTDSTIFLLGTPLPISRIKSIVFNDKDLKDRIIAVTNLSSAFIPKDLPRILPTDEAFDLSYVKYKSETVTNDFSREVSQYNKILGGLALLRLSGEDNLNYPENYYSTLALFNKVVEDDLRRSGKTINSIFHDAFVGKDKFRAFLPYLTNEVNEKDVEKAAKDENQRLDRNKLTGLLNIDSLEKIAYILGVLFSYGVGEEPKAKKIDSLIAANFRNGIKPGRSETVALCYGLNRGYSVFSNRYRVGDNESTVKFELKSKLDYYTIESAYQFAFNKGVQSNSFPYLDEWIPELNLPKPPGSYTVLDQVVSGKKIPQIGSQEYIQSLLQSFFQKSSIQYFTPFIEALVKKILSDVTEQNSVKPRITTSVEAPVSLSENKGRGDENEELKKRNIELEDLVSKLYKEKSAKNIKSLIDNHRKKGSDESPDLFSKQ
ncbi:MAG: hypothetical protein HOP08_05745 [Cyclobacteriaceae bacterium]|nr:hypothetical protein [Cyclobacteriaceae bacterium]